MPDTMKDLLTLPGVARKTAAVVLWGAYGKNEGVAVDTHVGRIAFRLGLTKSKAQNRIEQDLMAVFPRAEWGLVNHRMVSFGRDVCRAQKPLCAACEAAVFCPQEGVAGGPSKKTGKAKAVAGKSSSGRLKKTTDQRKDIKESQAAPCVSGATGGRKA